MSGLKCLVSQLGIFYYGSTADVDCAVGWVPDDVRSTSADTVAAGVRTLPTLSGNETTNPNTGGGAPCAMNQSTTLIEDLKARYHAFTAFLCLL